MTHNIISKIFQILPKLLAIIAIIFLCGYVFDPYIWGDEAYTIKLANCSYWELIGWTTIDSHPPLYYLMLKTWFIAFSFVNEDIYTQILLGKVLSLIPCVLTVIMCGVKLREELGSYGICILVIVFSGIFLFVDQSNDIRMYTWATFFFVALTIYARDIMIGKDNFVLLTIFTILAIYTHYMVLISSFFVWVVLLVYLLKKDRKKAFKLIICGCIVSIVFVPWLLVLIEQTGRCEAPYFAPHFSIVEIVRTALAFAYPTRVLILLILIISMWKYLKRGVKMEDLFPFIVFALTIIVAIIISVTIRNVVKQAQYFMPILFTLWVFFVIILGKHDSKYVYILTVTLFIAMISTNYYMLKEFYFHVNGVEENKEFFGEVKDGDIFIFDHNEEYGSYLDAEVLAVLIGNDIYVYTDNGFYAREVFEVLGIKVFNDEGEFWESMKEVDRGFYYCDGSLDSESGLKIPVYYKRQGVDRLLLHKRVEMCKYWGGE